MLRVDLEAREVDAPVGELAEWPPGPPRPGGWFAGARAAHGIALHQEYQEEARRADASFEAEKSLSFVHEAAEFTVHLHGRADGVRRTADGALLVEEIKSTTRATGQKSHRRQLRLYALCLASAEPECEVRGRLVLISPVDGTRRIVDVPCEPARVRRELNALVARVIAAARRDEERRRRRVEAAGRLRFPYADRRPGQEELETAVTESLDAGRPLLAMAPTGTGKTISALLPALRYALKSDAALWFLTAKTSQQELAARTFLDLAAEGLSACTLRAKARLCPTGTLLCHPERCTLLARCSVRGRVDGVVEQLLTAHPHVAPEAVLAAGKEHELCPYVLTMSLTGRVDVVIGDYNYLYGPATAITSRRREVVAIVDEAHNLFDRARDHHSLELPRSRITEARNVAPPEAAPFLGRLEALLDELGEEAELEHGSGFQGHRPLPERPRAWDELAAEATHLAVVFSASDRAAPPDDPFLGLLREVMWLRELLVAGEPELIAYAHAGGVGVLCVDPARRLAERHREARGTVALSATLSPLSYYTDVLGFRSCDPLELSLPSPFPPENRCIVIDPGVDTTYRARTQHYDAIARRLRRYVTVMPGHHAAFFPSFAFLEAVRSRLNIRETRLLVQSPRQSHAESRRILDALREGEEPTLLLAVTGGSFGEGIDLPGTALIGVIIVGPCLPPVGFERACMRHHFEATCGEGFNRAMLIPGMQRVIQAAGRVHRCPTDVGSIVLLGQRFATDPFLECLPPSWYHHDPRELVADDPHRPLRDFWRPHRAGAAALTEAR